MQFAEFTKALHTILHSHPLPGPVAQYLMASEFYRSKKIDLEKLSGYKKSAVCVLLYEKNDQVYFLLIRRPDTHQYHAGQIALPGGSCDLDESFEQTALRELLEETGIEIAAENILGKLSPLYIPLSNFYIQPVIAHTTAPLKFVSCREVEEVIEFPLAGLLDETILGETEVTTMGDLKIKTPYFNVQGSVLWGATAMLLSEMKELLKEHRATFSFLFR